MEVFRSSKENSYIEIVWFWWTHYVKPKYKRSNFLGQRKLLASLVTTNILSTCNVDKVKLMKICGLNSFETVVTISFYLVMQITRLLQTFSWSYQKKSTSNRSCWWILLLSQLEVSYQFGTAPQLTWLLRNTLKKIQEDCNFFLPGYWVQ